MIKGYRIKPGAVVWLLEASEMVLVEGRQDPCGGGIFDTVPVALISYCLLGDSETTVNLINPLIS